MFYDMGFPHIKKIFSLVYPELNYFSRDSISRTLLRFSVKKNSIGNEHKVFETFFGKKFIFCFLSARKKKPSIRSHNIFYLDFSTLKK